ncbi:MAG: NAD(P)/FAD-dependent oxidoreductase [Cytophagales bacterium]|nr:NAD(P)/FAD-dependent oxidoreductase [Bernardetiaceae bacterium]MDW8211813.1 NAD(P)/FAD-dependent oxidoreductase [Cytophagales bacterium]
MYDFVIIGGGLAGLTTAILLGKAGGKVLLLEKNQYPFHRVCGEYVSNEVLPFLESIGFYPFQWGAVAINRLLVTTPQGRAIELPLQSGGFGISRYLFDAQLARIAAEHGVEVLQACSVESIEPREGYFKVVANKQRRWNALWVVAAHGKRSALDKSLKRKFLAQRSPYVGVKYHIEIEHKQDLIALHNFEGGYCGISRIEENKSCLCYLVTRQQLKKCGSIEQLERKILHQNPFLREIFSRASRLYSAPKVINEISFATKTVHENGILMCGDAAGMIAPLCGNGMAMAIRSGALLAGLLLQHQAGNISRTEVYQQYALQWRALFARRLWVGRQIQRFFGSTWLTEAFVSFFQTMPWLATWLVRQTHGAPFDRQTYVEDNQQVYQSKLGS